MKANHKLTAMSDFFVEKLKAEGFPHTMIVAATDNAEYVLVNVKAMPEAAEQMIVTMLKEHAPLKARLRIAAALLATAPTGAVATLEIRKSKKEGVN